LTHIADDAHGQQITAHLTAGGVHLAPGSTGAERTPTATAYLAQDGGARYDFDLAWDPPAVDLAGVGHLHAGSIAATLEPGATQVLGLVQACRAGATISYDPNLRPTIMGTPHDVRSRVEELIGWTDVVKASEEDLAWLYADTPLTEVASLWGQLGP